MRRHNVPAWMEDIDVISHGFDNPTVDNSHNPIATSSSIDANNVFQVIQGEIEETLGEHTSFENQHGKNTGQDGRFVGLLSTPEHIPIDSSSNNDTVNKQGQINELLETRQTFGEQQLAKLTASSDGTQINRNLQGVEDNQFSEMLGSTTPTQNNLGGNDQLIAFGEPEVANQLMRTEEPEMSNQLMDLGHVVADQLIQLVQVKNFFELSFLSEKCLFFR